MCWKCKRKNPYLHECPQNHKLDKIILENLEKCSKCLKLSFFVHHCDCDYKLCKNCFDYDVQNVLTCPLDHELKFSDKQKQRNTIQNGKKIVTEGLNVFCDSCNVNRIDIKNGYFTCDQPCDYDICISCVQRGYDDIYRSDDSQDSYETYDDDSY